ncbi:hypothetical protein [Psychroserpens algicola]|uniref:Uncharacterized protein n=1 Tax=Psychroserpens algicola TaxID=1719034 RepID=A0ABT0H4P5_9FLAO|nr:hypothetical protein [Psychroserpens algicola]MCK8479357.1 hypothetical protein [Psychroserpens algicola]
MKRSDNPKARILQSLIFFVVLAINLTMCQKAEAQQKAVKNTPMLPLIHDKIEYLDSLFTAAMKDAQNPEPHEISNKLINLETNKNLLDTIINGERYIKMVSWKAKPEWFPKHGKYNTKTFDIWVTVAPIIQDSCRNYYKTQKDPNMRLRQLLGLQPLTVETFFLELWVKPADLYRPAPDNETNDSTSGLNLPNNVSPAYRKWFNQTRAFQYRDCNDSLFQQYGYPWTQLGYTYDWSPDNPSHHGLSEFVINQKTIVYVSGKYSNKVYCTKD